MANATQYVIVITALDKAAATIRHVNQSITGLTSPFRNVGRAVAELGEAAGLTKLASATENAIGKFGVLGSKIAGLLGPLAAIGALATAGGLISLAKDSAEWGHQLEISAQKTGVAADALAKLHYVGQTAGLDPEMMDKGLFKLNVIIQKGRQNSKDILSMLRATGIPLRDAQGHARNVLDVWKDLGEAMRKNPLFQQRIAAATFGARFGAAMIPALLKDRKETQRMFDDFTQAYGSLSPKNLKAAVETEESLIRMKLYVSGLKFAVGSALFPALEKLIVPLTQWIGANRVLISQKVGAWADRVARYVQSIDWQRVANTAMTFARAVATVGRVLGPVGTTIAVTAVLFSPFIAATLSAGAALVKLSWAIGAVGVRLSLLVFAPIAASIGNFVLALQAGYGALAAFELSLAATPVGWIIAGVTAIAGAAYLVYRYWTPIKSFFAGVWRPVVGAFKWAWNNIVPWIPGVGLVKLVIANWNVIGPFFGGLWHDVVASFRWARNFAVGAWDYASQAITAVWSPIAGFFRGLWTKVTNVFVGAEHAIIAAWHPITQFFSGLFDGLTAVFQKAWAILKPIIDATVGGAKWLAEHTGLFDAAHTVAHVATTVVHTVTHVVRNAGAAIESVEQHGEAISRLGNKSVSPVSKPTPQFGHPHIGKLAAALVVLKTKDGLDYTVNKQYAKNFAGFVNALTASGYKINSISGYNKRNVAGTNVPSFHSLGMAIDVNPRDNPLGPTNKNNLPKDIAALARKYGLGWGGNWHSKKDPMHFSMAASEGGAVTVDRYGNLLSTIRLPAIQAQRQQSQPVISRGRRDGFADARGSTHGRVSVDVNVKAPRGTTVKTGTGGRNPPDLNTGRSWT